jgi:nucleotide-binding universal stress UspA family protein
VFRQSNILMATDFSHYALYAVKYAVALARKFDGIVHVAHVLDTSVYSVGSGHGLWLTQSDTQRLVESMTEHAESRLEHLKQMIEDEGAQAETHVVEGVPYQETIRLAEQIECEAIVIATHGRTGFEHMVFGSVCERVVLQSPIPVLCIKHPEHEFVKDSDLSLSVKRVLFPTDFSAQADRALKYASSLCREFDATLVLFHATEVPVVLPEFMPDTVGAIAEEMGDRARKDLEAIGAKVGSLDTEIVTRTGVPHREIAQFVDDTNIDLVVVPTHGASGYSRLSFGRVASKVVRLAKCPVLTVPPEVLVEAE